MSTESYRIDVPQLSHTKAAYRPNPRLRGAFPDAAEEAKAVREGDEVLREMSRSPSVQKERSEQEPPEKGPTPQCRPFPHKTLEVCVIPRCSSGHASMCITLSYLAAS